MSDEATFSLAVVRRVVAERAAETSLHSTATEIGMSYTGLRGFLAGGRPHTKTRKKVLGWYAQHRKSDGRASAVEIVPREDLDAAVTLLATYLAMDKALDVRLERFRSLAARIAHEAGLPDV